jgi:putative CocE/NonD family hydrolase
MAEPTHTEAVAFLKEVFSDAPATRMRPVRAFETGAEEWHDLENWPPPGSFLEEWNLAADGTLSTDAAPGGMTIYTYDPGNPTPAVGGPSLLPKTAPVDNREHERRPDVAVFRSAPLDTALEIAGQPVARVRFRSSAPSFDVFLRITDVHPDGRSMTVCDGIRRVGSVGTAEADPAPDEEGFREIEVRLWPAFHRFDAGHAVGVQVSSGAHPRYARNPGSADPAFDAADTVVAQQEISHDGPSASRVELPVWNR